MVLKWLNTDYLNESDDYNNNKEDVERNQLETKRLEGIETQIELRSYSKYLFVIRSITFNVCVIRRI